MKTAQGFELQDFKKSLVKPFYKRDHPPVLKAALWDLLHLDGYFPVIFFYKSTGSSFAEQVAHLKESLSKALVPNYPFAGQWVNTHDERVRELLCNDEGVPFFEARIDEDLETVVGDMDSYRAVPALGNLNLVGFNDGVYQQRVDFPMPPLVIQVTGFKCGGLSLYVAFSHQATDGKGFFDFTTAWSDQAIHGKPLVEAVQDRSITVSLENYMGWVGAQSDADTPRETQSNGHFYQSNGTSTAPNRNGVPNGKHASNSEAREESRSVAKDHEDNTSFPTPMLEEDLEFPIQIPMRTVEMAVRKEAILELKMQAIADSPEEYVTTVDCISAHFWRSLNSLDGEFRDSRTRTRPFHEGRSPEFVLGTAVDCRKRCHDPPLPDSYSPNCFFAFLTPRLPPAELARKTELEVARIFHQAVREITPTTWRRILLANMGFRNFQDCEFRHVFMTSWLAFPMYNLAFRQGIGKPVFVGLNFEGGFLPEGYVVFLPPRPGSSAAANIHFAFQDDIFEALTSSKQFRSFFH